MLPSNCYAATHVSQELNEKDRVQFYQHFTPAFFLQKRIEQLFSSYKPKTQLCNFWHQNFIRKTREKNVDEIDSCGNNV